jgi:hypothetical protein
MFRFTLPELLQESTVVTALRPCARTALSPTTRLPAAGELARALALAGAPADLAPRLAATLAEHQALARAEEQALAGLFAGLPVPRAVIPRLESDVHDLAGLARLGERL